MTSTVGASAGQCAVFLVDKVVNETGERTGCFLYRGTLVAPEVRSCTPQQGLRPAGADDALDQLGGTGLPVDVDTQWDAAGLEGQELTLYMSYEEPSPKMKQRARGGAGAAPWRAILRDQSDEMVFCVRGLPMRAQLDSELHLATWGQSIAIAFPTAAHADTFANRLAGVTVECCSLADTPQGALVWSMQTPPCPMHRNPDAPAGDGQADASGSMSSCFAGSKRKAEMPAALMTPVAKPRLMAMLTPTNSGDLGPL